MINRFTRNLQLGYGISIMILILVGIVSYATLQSLLNSNRLVRHSGQVMQKLEKVLSIMKDAETGQRGYLLTGQSSYLAPYNGAYRQARQQVNDLAILTADNPVQQRNIAAIVSILDHRLNDLQSLITKKKRALIVTATELDAEKAAMDDLRIAVARAEKDEQALLDKRSEQLNSYTALVPGFIVSAILIAIGIVVYSYRTVVRDFLERERLRKEIEAQQEETAALNEELSATNEELSATNDKLVQAREELFRLNESLEERIERRTKALQASEEKAQSLNEELTAINEELAATNEELLGSNEELAESSQRLQEMVDELRKADEHSAKLVAIVESSDDAILGKNQEGIITSWNRGAQQIFGYNEEEMVGQSILKLIPEDLQHEEPVILSRLSRGEKIDHYETLRRTKDGRLINVSLTISPIRDKEGRVIGISKIARDITEQKLNEQRKNDFIGMASHELKTPLTSLAAIIQVLKLKLNNTSDKFVPQALNKAVQQTRKMTAMINGFLNVSRLESGKLIIEKGWFELTDLIMETLEEVQISTSTHTFEFDRPADIQVFADRDKIGSVISNLLSNAVKYSPRGKAVVLRCIVHTEEVVVSVTDEGPGINPLHKDKIFERYYRLEFDENKHISGFGIGLYLCREIIKQHDGRIWVDGEPDSGSTFYFSLPTNSK